MLAGLLPPLSGNGWHVWDKRSRRSSSRIHRKFAAKGAHHLRIYKTASDDTVISGTEILNAAQRTEEIARMLAGETITAEARAAATALLGK